MRTRVKICGITTQSTARAAAFAGADALGFVFYPPSKRFLTTAQALAICSVLPAFVSRTGLWVNPKTWEVAEVLAKVPIDTLQFHGEETGAFCRQFGIPYIKALSIARVQNWQSVVEEYADAQALLLDSPQGGSGQPFDWKSIPSLAVPLIIAGGLQEENVETLISTVRPYGVDVSSGVESTPGVKDIQKIQLFMKKVQQADRKIYGND